jgi:pilus assembly protein CpaF
MDLPSRAIREQIASAVHLIIQQTRLHDGSRKVIAISEITGIESGVVTLQDIFLFQQTGFDEKHKVIGAHDATGNIPKFIQQLKRRGIDTDMSIFARKAQANEDGPRRRAK